MDVVAVQERFAPGCESVGVIAGANAAVLTLTSVAKMPFPPNVGRPVVAQLSEAPFALLVYAKALTDAVAVVDDGRLPSQFVGLVVTLIVGLSNSGPSGPAAAPTRNSNTLGTVAVNGTLTLTGPAPPM